MKPLAIVGIGCRFPGGANSPEAFWRLLRDGVDAIGEIPADRFDIDRYFDPDPAASGKMYTRWGAYIDGIDLFDAGFFGFSPREAARMDPQHRFLLELTQEALEDAGIPTDRLAGSRTGVFVGVSTHDYGDIQMWPSNRSRIDGHANSGVAGAIAANRVSYAFDFRGPSMVVDTACSSSLTAVHLAARSLETGECEIAVVGGAQVLLTPELTIGFCKASMISPDGRSRAFDAAANGYVRSEGAGVVILKPLDAALADGDRVYAAVLGSAINQDGRTVGMTVPSSDAQEAMVRESLASAGVAPGHVQYAEAHGTGTPVGDPLEAAALGAALSDGRSAEGPCLIGSVKTNIGHLEAAAGIAGLIKAALCIHNGELPPSLHFTTPNPEIDFEALRLRVVTELRPWPVNGGVPHTALVNSFGFGGANASVVLQDVPAQGVAPSPRAEDCAELVTLSAKSPEALASLARAYLELGVAAPGLPLRDLAAATALRRAHQEHRLGVVATTGEELADALDGFLAGERRAAVASGRRGSPRLAFVFSGMGPQWWGMGRQLMAEEPVFRDALERCEAALGSCADWSLLEELGRDEATSRVGAAELAQVTNFSIQVALAALWQEWGIVPDAVVGHSAGEIAAAHVSGALDLEAAVLVAHHRGRLQARATGEGKMLAAGVGREEAEALAARFDGAVSIAAVNAPSSVTFSGDASALAEIETSLRERRIFARMLPVAVPYHSAKMDAIRDELIDSLATLRPQAGHVPMVSVVTADWIDGVELDADYWWRNVRQPVLFGDGVARLTDDGYGLFLELGPHPVLAASVRECLIARESSGIVLSSIRRKEDERMAMLRALATMYVAGREPDWRALHGEGVAHLDLPRYPWQRERHWFESAPADAASLPVAVEGSHPLLARRVRGPSPIWEGALGGERMAWLDDHVLQGTTPFPGAGYVELALAAARELYGSDTPGVGGLEFRRALFLGQRERTLLQVRVDPQTRRCQMHSSELESDGAWVLNAEAAVLAGEGEPPPRQELSEHRRRCPRELEHGELYAQLAARGFGYGPAFQGMEQIWQGDGEAYGRIALGESTPEIANYEVHPALLDAAFQLLIVAADSRENGERHRGFLPVAVDEVRLFARPGSAFWVSARMRSHSADAFVGDIDLLDDDGEVLVAVRGLTSKLLDEVDAKAEGPADWLYDYRWEPSSLGGEEGAALPDAFPIELPDSAALARQVGWSAYYDEVEPLLNEAAAGFAARALSPETPDSPFVRSLRAGAGGGGGGAADPEAALARLVAEHPEYALDAELLGLCGRGLPAVLAGETDVRELLFSSDALDLLTRFYAEAPTARFYNGLLAEVVSAAVASGNGDRPLRMIEVGAGTGGTTSHVLPHLREADSYLFTDVSPAFTARAREAFRGRVAIATLDLERPPGDQGLGDAAFDIVIAANVLHATADLRTTLEHVRGLLAPRGLLVLLEITRRPFWLDLVFGLNEGWWRFSDHALRSEHALLGADDWRGLLADCGFTDVQALSDAAPDGVAGQSVLVARTPAAVAAAAPRTEPWLVLADRGGVAERLAARAGRPCTLVYQGDDVRAALATTFAGIVSLWALDMPSADGLTADELVRAQASTCGAVVDLLRALDEVSGRDGGLLLVTAGAQEWHDGDRALAVGQSAVWGLGRVIVKERPELGCRMIDLGPEPGEHELDALARELLATDGEEEVALRGSTRLVRRLRRHDAAPAAEETQAARPGESFRATIGVPGALESIAFRRRERRAPGPREVEIEVDAVGVNFRDVMLALGMLPRLALDESPGTDLIGLECAGRVAALGDEVEGLAVGDEVVAIGYGAVGSHMTTGATHVAPRPAVLDREQAAAVPVAFVTAQSALVHLARLQPGERVLIHAAAGGVGHAAIQVAHHLGAVVIATAGSDEKRDYVRSLGVEHVFDSRSLDFGREVLEATGGVGVDVVLNSLAGEAIDAGIEALAPHGRFVEIGKRDVYENRRLGLLAFRNNLSYFALDIDKMGFDRPEAVGALLREVLEAFEEGAYAAPPITRFPVSQVGEALRYVAQAQQIGKVVLDVAREPVELASSPLDRPPVSAEGTYLVTGGLGGFGMAVAEWLVGQGARSLVLVGRGDPDAITSARLAALRTDGVSVETMRADVTELDDVRRMLTTIRSTLPPLTGFFHAAMVLDDAPLAELDEARFEHGLAAKVAGAWNLHLETLDDPIETAVFFSSIAGLLGNPLQGNYAAANAFLGSLAHHRRALGLPGLAIDWGVLEGTGYVSRHGELGPYLARQGYLSFTPDQALAALGTLLRLDTPQVMAARVDWQQLAVASPAVGASPRLRHFVEAARGADAGGPSSQSDTLAELLAAPEVERAELARVYLSALVGRVLGVPAARIDVERPLTEMGLDSLIAVELMTLLKNELHVELAAVQLLEGVSVERLVELVLAGLPSALPDAPSAEPTAAPTGSETVPESETLPTPVEPVPPPSSNGSKPVSASEALPAPLEREALPSSNGSGIDYSALDYERWSRGQRLTRGVVGAGFRLGSRVRVEGREHLPLEGGFILATNHLSMADVPLLLTEMSRPTIVLATDELRPYPWLRWFLSDLGNAIWLSRGTGNLQALEQGVAVLRAGGIVGLGPEGRRSQTGALERAGSGVAYLATQAGVPVVPAAAWGQERLGTSWRRLRRAPIDVRFGRAVRLPTGGTTTADLADYTEQVMHAIADLLPVEYRGVYENGSQSK